MSRSTVHGANSNASLVALSSYTPSSWIHSFSVPDGIVDLLVAIQYTYSIYIYYCMYICIKYLCMLISFQDDVHLMSFWPPGGGNSEFFLLSEEEKFSGHFSKAMETSVWMNLPSWCNHRSWSHSLRESVDELIFFSGFVGMTHAIRVVTIKD